MKKIFSLITLAITVIGLTSCNKEERNEASFANATVTVSSRYSSDFLSIFDVTYTYKNWDGTTGTQKITSASSQSPITLNTTSKNGTCSVTVNIEKKADATYTKGTTKYLSVGDAFSIDSNVYLDWGDPLHPVSALIYSDFCKYGSSSCTINDQSSFDDAVAKYTISNKTVVFTLSNGNLSCTKPTI